MSEKLYLRRATETDEDTLFDLVNDEEARKKVADSHIITREEHKSWFKGILNDETQVQFILMRDDNPIGQIRLGMDDNSAEIDYSISKDERGYRYGKAIIGLAINEVRDEFPQVKQLIGKVKDSNVASYYCFEENGFEEKNKHLELNLDTNMSGKLIDDLIYIGGLKVLFLTNNRNALGLFEWIQNRCDVEIYSQRLTKRYLEAIKPELVISYNYNYIVPKECIEYMNENIINMHISFLPWNKGVSPNIWSFIDGTPKGVTIHLLSEGLDEGDILFQEEMDFDPNKETFQTTYEVLNQEIVDLFKRNWPVIIGGDFKALGMKQPRGGSYHTIADLRRLKEDFPFEWSDNISVFLKKYKAGIKR